MINKTQEVRCRIEPELKHQAQDILASKGIDLSTAIRIFLREVVTQQGLPFKLAARSDGSTHD